MIVHCAEEDVIIARSYMPGLVQISITNGHAEATPAQARRIIAEVTEEIRRLESEED